MTHWLVIGGGSAGCVAAARLSEDSEKRVTLVEAGPDHGATIGAHRGPVLDDDRLRRDDVLVVRRAGAAPVPYLQGFGLGGTSLINGSLVVGDLADAAVGHELPVEPVLLLGPVAAAVMDATSDAARVGLIARAGHRVSVADIYLRPVLDRANLTVRCDTRIDRLEFEGRRVVGAVAASGDHIGADRVVLCAGAIESPAVLLRSGIDTPGVGEGLQDHAGVAFSFDLAVGVADSSVPAIGATVERPGRQIIVIDHLASPRGSLIAGLLDVTSVGRVSVPNPGEPAHVLLGQLSTGHDRDGLARAVHEALDLIESPALRTVLDGVYIDEHGTPASAIMGDDDAIRSWLADHLGGYHHLAGSCRLGSVLTPAGAVVGYDGLMVCDASALPGVPLANPYLEVVRLTERLVQRWK